MWFVGTEATSRNIPDGRIPHRQLRLCRFRYGPHAVSLPVGAILRDAVPRHCGFSSGGAPLSAQPQAAHRHRRGFPAQRPHIRHRAGEFPEDGRRRPSAPGGPRHRHDDAPPDRSHLRQSTGWHFPPLRSSSLLFFVFVFFGLFPFFVGNLNSSSSWIFLWGLGWHFRVGSSWPSLLVIWSRAPKGSCTGSWGRLRITSTCRRRWCRPASSTCSTRRMAANRWRNTLSGRTFSWLWWKCSKGDLHGLSPSPSPPLDGTPGTHAALAPC